MAKECSKAMSSATKARAANMSKDKNSSDGKTSNAKSALESKNH